MDEYLIMIETFNKVVLKERWHLFKEGNNLNFRCSCHFFQESRAEILGNKPVNFFSGIPRMKRTCEQAIELSVRI